MKSLIKFTILFSIFNFPTLNEIKAQWFEVSQIPGLNLRQISVADSNVVWITGTQGSESNLKIYRSINGGLDWDSIPLFPSQYPIYRPIFSARDSSTAFLVFDKYVSTFSGSSFYKTTNAGQDWIFIDSSYRYFDLGFSKSAPEVGVSFAWQDDSLIYYKTTDMGNTWVTEFENLIPPMLFSPMFIVDEDFFGYIYHANHNADLGAVITSDGGISWYHSFDQQGYGTAIAFNDDKLTGIMTRSGNNNFLKTTNGGLNWNVLTTGVSLTSLNWFPVWISGTSTVFLSSYAGIIRSDNNGEDFVIQDLPIGDTVRRKIDYSKYGNKIILYGICQNGIIIKSRQEIVITNLQHVNANIPSEYMLYQNYPNPFNPVTKIKFSVPENQFIKIKVYDIRGKEIQELVNEKVQAGNYETEFNGNNFSSGIYYYTLESEKFKATKKMILIK